MNKDELLDELDTVLAAKMSDKQSKDSKMKALSLYGRLRALADSVDKEDGEVYFSRILKKDMPNTLDMLSRCYQTLIDEGKI